jgi:hypothetical protein
MSAAPPAGPRGAAPPGAAWLAWSALGCSLLFILVGAGMLLVERAATYDYAAFLLVGAPVLATVGALVAARRPDHPIGWLFTGIGLVWSVQLVVGSYAVAALSDEALPAGAVAAWAAEELRLATLGALVLVLLLFPTGRLPSRRWRGVLWLWIIGLASLMAYEGLTPGRGEHLLGYENPFGLARLSGLLNGLSVLAAAFGLAELAAVLSLVVRLRRARGVERQQLKWFVYAAVLAVVVLVAANVLVPDLMEHGPLGTILWGAVPVSLAVAVAVAVLRYRLYDIDRLVNRTLVYGLLTAILAVVYVGIVLALGQVFGGVGGNPPTWAVAGATLAVAALFQPARRRVQAVVDRRFDRRRYDAAKTVEAFSARLRDEVDLDTLSEELLAVVDQTMQPTRMSLWLRLPRATP